MAKKVLILSASPRRNGNSDILCRQFKKGAEKSGHTIDIISLYEKNIDFCELAMPVFEAVSV